MVGVIEYYNVSFSNNRLPKSSKPLLTPNQTCIREHSASGNVTMKTSDPDLAQTKLQVIGVG
jgi:hypothetical protein